MLHTLQRSIYCPSVDQTIYRPTLIQSNCAPWLVYRHYTAGSGAKLIDFIISWNNNNNNNCIGRECAITFALLHKNNTDRMTGGSDN